MKIAIYSRKSKFTGKGESIQNQIQLCKEYANNHFDATEILIYEDEGFSAKNTNRPQFKKMTEDAKSGLFSVLICYRLDRISRNISDFSNLIEFLTAQKIDFVSIREQFDTSTPMGRAMMFITSVFAQLERETIAERIKDNMYQLARTGRWLGGICPTGFKSEPISYIDSNLKEKRMYRLTPVIEEIETVKLIYDKYQEFHSLSKLETFCLKNNITSRNNKNLQKSSLADILSNPVYTTADEYSYDYFERNGADIANDPNEFNGEYGIIGYNKKLVTDKISKKKSVTDWIIAVGRHEGIISGSDWVSVQNIMEKNKLKAPRKSTSTKALLSGLIECGSCGSFFRVGYGSTKEDGERYYYYRCNMKDLSRRDRCNIKNLSGEKFDDIVVEKIKSLVIPRILKSMEKDEKGAGNVLSLIRENKSKINANKRGIDNLLKRLALNEDEAISTYLLDEIKKLHNEISALDLKINELENSDVKVDYSKLKDKLVNFSQIIDYSSFEEKKSLINSLIKRIIWDGHKLTLIIYDI